MIRRLLEARDPETGAALDDTSLRNEAAVLFLAGEPLTDKLTWQGGNAYTVRLRPGTYMQAAMLVPEAIKLKKKRWAVVYPNYEYGQSAVAAFKQLMKAAQPDVDHLLARSAVVAAELAEPDQRVGRSRQSRPWVTIAVPGLDDAAGRDAFDAGA